LMTFCQADGGAGCSDVEFGIDQGFLLCKHTVTSN
jgi:hypothetical protein